MIAETPSEGPSLPVATNSDQIVDQPPGVSNADFGTVGSKGQRRRLESNIRKMEKLTAKFSKFINKASNFEMDLDSLECDNTIFIKLENVQRRYLKVTKILENLRKKEQKLKRPIEKVVKYEGSGYESMDKAITCFINRLKLKNNQNKQINFAKSFYNFPSKDDILSIIKQENAKNGLNLSPNDIEMLCKKLSNDVIAFLKKRTVAERRQILDDILSDSDDEDPALTNPELLASLTKNKALGDEANKLVFRSTLQEIENVEMPPLIQQETISVPLVENLHKSEDQSNNNQTQPMDSDDCPSIITCALCWDKEKCACFEQKIDEKMNLDIKMVTEDDPPNSNLDAEMNRRNLAFKANTINLTKDNFDNQGPSVSTIESQIFEVIDISDDSPDIEEIEIPDD